MKLRKNKLTPLQFDPAEALRPELGLDPSVWQRSSSEAVRIRDLMRDDRSAMSGFVGLPHRLLSEYEAGRQQSELGRVFQTANRIQALVDRTVVLACNTTYSGSRALFDALCQPYWNDSSRGERGSKPRMVWDGNSYDNDATQALLHLLDAHRTPIAKDVDEDWSLVVLRDPGPFNATDAVLSAFVQALEASHVGDLSAVAQRIVGVVADGTNIATRFDQHPSWQRFHVPEGIEPGCSVFTTLGLIPAAIVGINVIELLQGAAWMTDHFLSAPFESNMVLQFAAVHHAWHAHGATTGRTLGVSSQSLESFGRWYEGLMETRSGTAQSELNGLTKFFLPDVRTTLLKTATHTDATQTRSDRIFHRVVVDTFRFDALVSEQGTIPQSRTEAYSDLAARLRTSNTPTTMLRIPQLDELHLGQLIQMMMLATEVEIRVQQLANAI